MRLSNRVRLRCVLGAAALFSACAGRARTGASTGNDALLQRMLVAEDARGTGAEGIAPLLEGEKSGDSTLHAVAVRGLARLKWTPTPPAPPANRGTSRPAADRPPAPPCARLAIRAHSPDLRERIPAADSLATCSDDGSTLLPLTRSADDNVRAGAIAGLARATKHAHDTVYISALSARGYQVVLAGARALAGSPNASLATPALLASLDRLSAERRENSRDERMMILDRVAEFGSTANASRVQPYITDFDTTVAAKAASILTKWTGTTVVARAKPLPIREEPLARIFRERGMQLRITMASGSSSGGVILINLFNTETPATIARITRLARAHYYDGLTWHRFVPNFVIQGGSPGANEVVGDGPFMRDELGGHSHVRGTVGISTRGHDTGDAQFFVNLVDNKRLDHDYTVFGEVVSGMDIVDKIREGDVMTRVEVINGNTRP
ncbi:MAG TPA: peptidylprolyl isomerase [Gemmatimonadaceae bacterium]|jgi:cyclophilin family peptidyl-prolyl cis-trans isomerase|nr:peptidylprolyl isomerase [Gemmatimonadaceae bacterium]